MKILDVFVVMPNHVHGIIIINKTNGYADTTSATGNTDVETQYFASLLRITIFCVSTAHYKKGTLFVDLCLCVKDSAGFRGCNKILKKSGRDKACLVSTIANPSSIIRNWLAGS